MKTIDNKHIIQIKYVFHTLILFIRMPDQFIKVGTGKRVCEIHY